VIIFHFPFLNYHFSLVNQGSLLLEKRVLRLENEKTAKGLQSRADELEERLIDFAVRIVNLSANLPKNSAGKHIAGQIMRSGTSPAPNYGEARGAESHADFVHKLRIALKELNETSIWLRIIDRSQLLKRELLAEIIEENRELSKDFYSLSQNCSQRIQNHK
jgi:four helix bundle protein